MNIKYKQTCRICGNPNLTQVIDLNNQHFQGSFIKDGVPDPPLRKTPNLVVRCDTSKNEYGCGLIQTKHTIPPRILYTNYWYQSGISATMRQHLKSIVDDALEITQIKQGSVLDIASNDNTLLRNYPKHFTKVGVDPSDIASRQKDEDITVINDLFPTSKLPKIQFDIVTSIACYYDIEEPKRFALEIKNILREKGIWIFEVAYWPSMLENLAYDSIVNEHIIHYHLAPLEIMFSEIGFKIFRAQKTQTNGGSIKVFVTHQECMSYDKIEWNKELTSIRMEEFCAGLDDEKTYEDFRGRVNKQASELKELITNLKKEGKTIHVYGASTKLNTILGFCDIGPDLIPYAAERSPEKWGASTISGIKLISEEQSRSMNPDYYLVGPYHFKDEILKRESDALSRGIKFIFPLPKITIC